MSLTRQVKVKPDDALEILAKENDGIYLNMDSGVCSGVLMQSTFGTAYKDL
jgi:hypothetical protein